jgi:hypothetical protein
MQPRQKAAEARGAPPLSATDARGPMSEKLGARGRAPLRLARRFIQPQAIGRGCIVSVHDNSWLCQSGDRLLALGGTFRLVVTSTMKIDEVRLYLSMLDP